MLTWFHPSFNNNRSQTDGWTNKEEKKKVNTDTETPTHIPPPPS